MESFDERRHASRPAPQRRRGGLEERLPFVQGAERLEPASSAATAAPTSGASAATVKTHGSRTNSRAEQSPERGPRRSQRSMMTGQSKAMSISGGNERFADM
jgi:hypothetical protein